MRGVTRERERERERDGWVGLLNRPTISGIDLSIAPRLARNEKHKRLGARETVRSRWPSAGLGINFGGFTVDHVVGPYI